MKNTPNVGFIRPELEELLPQYELIRDAIAGEVAVKNAGDKYLPRPDPSDISRENKERYKGYLRRAVFYNVTRRTLSALVGQVFTRPPIMEYPELMAPLVKNASGNGVSLELTAKRALNYTLAYSRAGIYVDYPSVDENVTTVADIVSGKIRPTINVVSPMEIINWKTMSIGAEEVLCRVVIAEDFCSMDDGFETQYDPQWRVLGLDAEGNYYQEIWREESKPTRFKRAEYYRHEIIYPRGSNGELLREIPFMFIGSDNNDCNPDNPHFYDLASLNISHYCNSADYEESVFVSGQPTLVISGIDDQWKKDSGGTARVGSVGGIGVPMGGDAKLIQAQPNSLVQKAMEMKEKQMIALGARVVEDRAVQRTATEVSLDSASQSSILASVTRNVNEAINWALNWAAQFIGINPELVKFDLNTDFDISKMKSEDRRQLLAEWQNGAITFEEMRVQLGKSGIATEDSESAKQNIQNNMTDVV